MALRTEGEYSVVEWDLFPEVVFFTPEVDIRENMKADLVLKGPVTRRLVAERTVGHRTSSNRAYLGRRQTSLGGA